MSLTYWFNDWEKDQDVLVGTFINKKKKMMK